MILAGGQRGKGALAARRTAASHRGAESAGRQPFTRERDDAGKSGLECLGLAAAGLREIETAAASTATFRETLLAVACNQP
jgi:hypothetical protein